VLKRRETLARIPCQPTAVRTFPGENIDLTCMASTLKAFPGIASLNFHVRPTNDSNKTTLCVEEDDVLELTSNERKGVWFLCHTRNTSGWVHAKEVIPVAFPAVFIINDELPSDAQICLRTK
jgi:hypothetical protein